MSELDIERMVSSKRNGEDHLRFSGLGYTIVRPGVFCGVLTLSDLTVQH